MLIGNMSNNYNCKEIIYVEQIQHVLQIIVENTERGYKYYYYISVLLFY